MDFCYTFLVANLWHSYIFYVNLLSKCNMNNILVDISRCGIYDSQTQCRVWRSAICNIKLCISVPAHYYYYGFQKLSYPVSQIHERSFILNSSWFLSIQIVCISLFPIECANTHRCNHMHSLRYNFLWFFIPLHYSW